MAKNFMETINEANAVLTAAPTLVQPTSPYRAVFRLHLR